jgi:hypothetical protein
MVFCFRYRLIDPNKSHAPRRNGPYQKGKAQKIEREILIIKRAVPITNGVRGNLLVVQLNMVNSQLIGYHYYMQKGGEEE